MTHYDSMPSSAEGEGWLACDVIRYVGERALVIRVSQTGAIIPIRLLRVPIEGVRATALHPLRAVEARVKLGPFEGEWFTECEIDIAWDTWDTGSFPAPTRYSRKRKAEEGGCEQG